MKRLFIAIDLSIGVVEELLNVQEAFHAAMLAQSRRHEQEEQNERSDSKKQGEKEGGKNPHENNRMTHVRWTSPENIHLTLKFLGDTEEALIPRLNDTLTHLVKPLFPFEVATRGVGFFPSPERPRIFWSGFDQQSAEVLSLLQQALERDLEEIGIPPNDREFLPHITLGRLRSRDNPDFSGFAEDYRAESFGKSYIKDFVLYQSELAPDGPRYTVLNRFPLGG